MGELFLKHSVFSAFINRIADKLQHLTVKSQGIVLFRIRCTTAFCLSAVNEQEAQLSQRDRATLLVIEYFAIHSRSLMVIRNDTVQWGCVSPY